MIKLLTSLEKYLLILVVFLLPLAFLPIFLSPSEPIKLAVLGISLALILVISSLKTIFQGSFTFYANSFDLPLIALALVYLASAILRTPNKMEAFFIPGTATLIPASVIFFFIAKSFYSEKKSLISALLLSAVLVAIISLLAFAGVLAKIPQLPAFAKDTLFTPLGSKLAEAIFLAILLPLAAGLILAAKEAAKKVFWLVALAIVTLALAISVYSILPGKPAAPNLPLFSTSWQVAVDALKVSPILGIGPANYLTAFNSFRPLAYNSTPTWALRFTTARDFPLTLMTETGLLGLTAFVLLLLAIGKTLKGTAASLANQFSLESGIALSLVISVIFLFLFPLNVTEVVVFVLLLALAAKPREISFQVPVLATGEKTLATKLPVILITLPVLAGVGAFGYYGFRASLAESKFKQSIEALAKNDAQTAYDLMRQTIILNPRVDRYRTSYGQINLALARALAQKKDLTEADKQTISQLIAQAIREAKAAVVLNPGRAGNWENLAGVYQAIMPFAQGADNFALQTFSQAIALDPINTNLRISLGGVYYALGRYDEAIDAFKLAVLTKPDHANAHYNLAAALREKGEIKKATEEMNLVLSLLGKESADYETAKKELEKLESLTPPQPAPEPVIKPPLELPEEATPPASTTP